MKTAISSTDNSFTSKIDTHFARCSYFVIFDSETGGIEFLPNPFKNELEDAGTLVSNFLKTIKVEKVIAGNFGIKVKSILDSLKIQMIVIEEDKHNVSDLLEFLKNKPEK